MNTKLLNKIYKSQKLIKPTYSQMNLNYQKPHHHYLKLNRKLDKLGVETLDSGFKEQKFFFHRRRLNYCFLNKFN